MCEVAEVAAVSLNDAEAVAPTCPDPGRTASTPLLTVIDAPIASRVVVELTVAVIEEDSVPLPVAVTTTVIL